MDITETTAPRSDQQNYDDYIAGPRTVTITEVKAGSTEQPVDIHLAEFPGRPYKPSKSMRRVLVAAWGPETSVYSGRRMTLVGDPSVKFGGTTVGGIKIAALSHIDGRLELMLTASKGKRAKHVVEPLVESAPATVDIATLEDREQLKALWKQTNNPIYRAQIEARVAELSALPQSGADIDPNAGVT